MRIEEKNCGRSATVRMNRSLLLYMFCVLTMLKATGQADSSHTKTGLSQQPVLKKYPKPEIFTSGFIDLMNSGQVNASARLIRLLIGMPGKFAIPLSVYSGVSANSFQNNMTLTGFSRNNDHLIAAFINPLGGLMNLSVDGVMYFDKKTSITRTGLIYHFGERVLTGYRAGAITDIQAGKPVNFPNSFASLGAYFQTGAWEKNNSGNLGIFWLVLRVHFTYSPPAQIRQFIPSVETNGVYTGYSAGLGVEINQLVNLKALFYQYWKNPELEYYLPIYQFSFNYSLRN